MSWSINDRTSQSGDALALQGALRELGIACAVEAREKLAVVIPHGDVSILQDGRMRREAMRLARMHGFTHLALEVREGGDSRDDVVRRPPSRSDGASLHRD